MKCEQSTLVTGANDSGAFEQTEFTPYSVFEETVAACNEANREPESRHEVRNDSGKGSEADSWIDWPRFARGVGIGRSGRAAHACIFWHCSAQRRQRLDCFECMASGSWYRINRCHQLPRFVPADEAEQRGVLSIFYQFPGEKSMTKERQNQREAKKQPIMTLKEKRNAKKSKQETKGVLASGKPT